VPSPLVLVLLVAGGVWGFVADRIGARWPLHEDGSVRGIDWRTPVSVIVGGLALALVPVRFADDQPAQVIFGAYVLALTLLLATDLDQRLLPNEITLPAIPYAFVVSLKAPKVKDLYNRVVRAYAQQLVPLRPQTRIQVRT
jgi:hypothetical protein